MASVHGDNPDWTPAPPQSAGLVLTPDGPRWFEPVPDEPGLWIEGEPVQGGSSAVVRSSAELLGQVLRLEREMARLSQELASRYEEIDLLYTISEILGRTVRLAE